MASYLGHGPGNAGSVRLAGVVGGLFGGVPVGRLGWVLLESSEQR